MIHEDFVTQEQATKLKKLGFSQWGDYIYHNDSRCLVYILSFDYTRRDNCLPCPTLYQAQKWLMDKKKILISIRPNDFVNDSGNTEIHYVADIFGTSKNHLELLHSEAGYETYEFALEDSINEALNLLEENKP